MVGMAGEDGQGAVDLLGGDDSGELVRQRNTTEGDGKIGSLEGNSRPAIRGADGEDQGLDASIAKAPYIFGEFLGAELLAAAIGEQEHGAGPAGGVFDKAEQSCLTGEDTVCSGRIPTTALQIAP